MKPVIAAIAIMSIATPALAAFNLVTCLGEHSKAECSRQMRLEEGLDKPLEPKSEITSDVGTIAITIEGENWLRRGWGESSDRKKELGITKDTGVGMLDIEKSEVRSAEFETVITDDMKALYKGLEDGFNKGKINIKANSQMELIPLAVTGGTGKLGRFCYTIDIKESKNVCVYEGFAANEEGQSYKLLGSIGDYNNMRQELESILTSLRFVSAPAAQPAQE